MARKTTVAGKPGSDPTLPNVPLTLKGHTYHLCYDFNAIAKTEELTGLNLLDSLDLQNLSVTKYRALLYSTLLTENPDITLEEVGQFINIGTLPEITVALVHAWTGSRPEIIAEKDVKVNPLEEQVEESSKS